ncbi:MAG: tRNA preQ1(34) S-adenosylmethionine ribosyltransferase-isomerase QueA [Xanthobacteraceae bacterium]|nr:tRNA preQ1(34) S-adenosylmethionine ribosyltransferase-isomerase QueA [Xanthobacteraceae bacterium]
MRSDLFDFELPPERIALRPAEPRDSARMLTVCPGGVPELADHTVAELPALLRPGDQIVVNDTKVIPAQLSGRRVSRGSEARVDVTLIKRLDGSRWRALAKGARKLAVGDVVRFGEEGKVCFLSELDATVEDKGEEGEITLSFAFHGPVLDQAIEERGEMPLPPYIAGRRPADERDRTDYQTLFAREEGAVAAPTAGLHFTPALVAALAAREIAIREVTLHVGAGTFLPVKAEDTEQHKMHAEWGTIDAVTADTLNTARRNGGRIVALGSTSLRLLESAATEDGTVHPFARETSIFITPGYRFRAVDVMMTNFHLPRSTLFMLVAAFCGLDVMKRAYAHAIAQGYRFYSYGDASLLFRA